MTVMDLVGWPLDTQYRHRKHRVPAGAVSECVAELSDAGFYRYTPAEDIEKAKRVPAESFEGYGYLFEYTNREAISDSEDINEGGVIHFLQDVRHFPPCSEIISTFVREEYQDRVDVVEFAEVHCRVWDWSEFVENRSLEWLLSLDRSIKMMNKLLETYEHEDRLYYHHTGNDTQVMLVTPLILRVLVRHGAVTPNTI
jgi:hypothetical protein